MKTTDVWGLRIAYTPAGRLWLASRGERLWGAEFELRWPVLQHRLSQEGLETRLGVNLAPTRPILVEACRALRAYFKGELDALKRVPLDLEGSPLQLRVWSILGGIAPGKTISYKQLAERAKHAGAFRAIGAANGANPCAVFVPCHRVVGTSGDLQGYGGGLDVKARLLTHEGVRNDGWRLVAKGRGARGALAVG